MHVRSTEWVTTVVCEGGPCAVMDAASFREWTGSVPFTELRARPATTVSNAAARFGDRRNVLHFWGNLGGAGERFVPCDDEPSALAEFDGLKAMARTNCPDLEIADEDAEGVTHMFDRRSGGRLAAELLPKSEYDAVWFETPDADGWVHPFADSACGAFWFLGGRGVVEVGIGDNELLLARTYLSGDAREKQARERDAALAFAVSGLAAEGAETTLGEIALRNGRVAVVWSALAFSDFIEAEASLSASRALPNGVAAPLSAAAVANVGAVLSVRPGRYRVQVASTDDGPAPAGRDWSVRWCRLTRVGDP